MKNFTIKFTIFSFLFSFFCVHYLFLGPIVSALANKYGCRTVCIAGSIFAALAFTLSTLSTNVKFFFITYGVTGGTGFGMIYLPAIVFVGYYFEKKRSLATGRLKFYKLRTFNIYESSQELLFVVVDLVPSYLHLFLHFC